MVRAALLRGFESNRMSAIPVSEHLPLPMPPDAAAAGRRRGRFGDVMLGLSARASAIGVLLMLLTLIGVLTYAAVPSLRRFGLSFVASTEWRPNELERPKVGPDGK